MIGTRIHRTIPPDTAKIDTPSSKYYATIRHFYGRASVLTDRFPDGIILKYYLYSITLSHGFVIPISIVYLQVRGLSFTEIGTVQAIFMAGWVGGEIPAGYVSDRIGRRNSLIIASTLTPLALVTLALGRSFLVFTLGFIIWAFGVAFRSGASSAWLYDMLTERLDEEEYSRVKGKGWSIRQMTTAVASILGSYLATIAWWSPFVANALLVASGIGLLITFPQSRRFTNESGEGEEQLTIVDALPLIRERFTQPPLRSFVIYMALFFGLVDIAILFIQPISINLGVPVAYLGWLYAGFSLVSAGAGYVAGDVKEIVGLRRWLFIAPPVVAGLFVIAVPVSLAVIPVFFVMRGVRSITTTLRSQYLNDQIDSIGRATLLSAASMVFALTAAVTRLIGGIVADFTSPILMLGLFGVLFIGGMFSLSLWESPVPSRTTET
jgi:MFS family permease